MQGSMFVTKLIRKKGCIIINLSLWVTRNNCFVLGYGMPMKFHCIGEEKWNYCHKVTVDEVIIILTCLCLSCCGQWHVEGDPWNHNHMSARCLWSNWCKGCIKTCLPFWVSQSSCMFSLTWTSNLFLYRWSTNETNVTKWHHSSHEFRDMKFLIEKL